MSTLGELIECLRRERQCLLDDIGLFETGKQKIGEFEGSGDFVDKTAGWVEQFERRAAQIEVVVDSHARKSETLTWQEKDVLEIFREMGVRPGSDVPVQSLWLRWGEKASNAEFVDAVRGLEVKGLLRGNASETAYALTEKGYALGSKR